MKRVALVLATLALPLSATAAQGPIERSGTIAHSAAGTAFPERIGEFSRASVTQFDAAGRDIAASYNAHPRGGRVLITAYIYPAPAAGASDRGRRCRTQFDEARAAAVAPHKQVDVVEEGAAPAVAGVARDLGHRAVLRFPTQFGERIETVRSEVRLYCYVGGNWLVKYRITSSEGLDADAVIEAFIRAGPWPGRIPPDRVA